MSYRTAQRGWIAPGVALAGLLIGLAALGGCAPTPAAPAASRSLGLYDLAEDLTNIQSVDGGVSLARGVLIEDDGPAFGIFDPLAQGGPDAIPGRPIRKSAADVTDTPYWEPLSKTCHARKTLLVASLTGRPSGQHEAPKPRYADLLIYAARRPDAKLIVQVNGSRVELPAEFVAVAATRPDKSAASTQPGGRVAPAAPRFDPPRWHRVSILADYLHTGENEIVLSSDTDSSGWLLLIAPREAYFRGTTARRPFPGRSFRSDDSGRTWQAGPKLGRSGLAAGEYAVRLWLDQHVLTGQWTGPMVDLVPTPNDTPIRQVVKFKSAVVQIDQSVPAGCKIEWEFRSGSVQLAVSSAWGPWTKFSPDYHGRFQLDAVNNRYVQLRATLATENPAVAPVIGKIDVAGQAPTGQPIPPGQLRLVEWTNPRIVRSALNFTYETWPNAKLKLLDDKFGLAAAVKSARTQFETAVLTLDWLKATMASHHVFVPSHTWNAADILSTQRTAPTEHLAYALVYCQALLAHGITARVGNPGSCVEFWSTDYGKWVMVDLFEGAYFLDAATGIPLNAWELNLQGQQLWLEFFRLQESRFRNPARYSPREFSDLQISLFMKTKKVSEVTPGGVRPGVSPFLGHWAMLLIPRNNFASADRPIPLTSAAPGWTELVVWEPSVKNVNDLFAEEARIEKVGIDNIDEIARHWAKGEPPIGPKPIPRPASELVMSQFPHHIDRLCDLYPTLNTVQMEVQYGKSPGELWVYLDTETPGFETFQVNFNQGGFTSIPGLDQNHFVWRLAPGPNSLQVRVRNKAGATGSISSISVQYLPVAPAAKTGG